MDDHCRIDKWLWAVRVFKTRSQAAEACRTGKVKIGGQAVKPSREIKSGDILILSLPPIQRTIQVKQLLKNRVGAKLVPEYLTDLTPQEEYEKLHLINQINFERRDKGTGRPTKKQRRLIDFLKGD